MKYADINKKFTEIVAEYLSKGYTFNTASMNGSQGETAKVDLTNGSEIIRVLMDTFSDWTEVHLEGVEIIVGRCTDEVTPNDSRERGILWNQNLETLSSERFYVVAENRTGERTYGTKEQAVAQQAKKYNRFAARCTANTKKALTPSAALIRMLKKRKGFTNATRTTIVVYRVKSGYEINLKARDGHISRTETIRFPKH